MKFPVFLDYRLASKFSWLLLAPFFTEVSPFSSGSPGVPAAVELIVAEIHLTTGSD